MARRPAFTEHHATQYKVLSDELRFYADQRFKVLGAYLVGAGLLANVVKDEANPVLCLVGALLAYLCLSWELRTTRWWGTLISQCQHLEDLAISSRYMIPGYKRYRSQNAPEGLQRMPHPRPSSAVAWMYGLILVTWLVFFVWHVARLLPSLHPTCCGSLRQPPQAGELKRQTR